MKDFFTAHWTNICVSQCDNRNGFAFASDKLYFKGCSIPIAMHNSPNITALEAISLQVSGKNYSI